VEISAGRRWSPGAVRVHIRSCLHTVSGGATGAATGAAIGCLATIPVGCLPRAAVGAIAGGAAGGTAGLASTQPPPVAAYPPGPPVASYPNAFVVFGPTTAAVLQCPPAELSWRRSMRAGRRARRWAKRKSHRRAVPASLSRYRSPRSNGRFTRILSWDLAPRLEICLEPIRA
jgi:hypothetical protein